MPLRINNLQSDSDLDIIRNSCDVLIEMMEYLKKRSQSYGLFCRLVSRFCRVHLHEKNFCIKHENIDCKDNTLTSARAKYSWSRASIITRISPLESLMSISSAPQSSQGHFHQYHQYVLSDNIGLHFDPKIQDYPAFR